MDDNSKIDSYSFALVSTVLILTGFGLLIIFSSSSISAYQRYGDAFYFFRKQAIVAIVGFGLIFLIYRMPFAFIERLTLPAVVLAVVLLILTLIPATRYTANGASRWIQFFGITFQPAEFAKLALILFLSKNLSRPNFNIKKLATGILPNLMVFGLCAVLIMVQPDFGSVFVLFSITFLMLFVAGLSNRYIIIFAILAILAIVVAIINAPYRMERLLVFLDPWNDVRRGGFQIIQSYLGFQNGGLLGLGLGESRQKLYFLPEAHTDFILSVIGEELGLIGVLVVTVSFIYLMVIGLKITKKQTKIYRKFLAFGITALITIQAMINIGVSMGVLPTKGIPLPFVSYGSSSLIVFLISVGILARASKDRGI